MNNAPRAAPVFVGLAAALAECEPGAECWTGGVRDVCVSGPLPAVSPLLPSPLFRLERNSEEISLFPLLVGL